MNRGAARHRPELIAHRGANREAPENSLPAFLRAMELGADAIELDVHATADGHVIVHHDPVPHATTSEPHLKGRAFDTMTLTEVSTFRLDGTVHIPRLEEVLHAVGDAAAVYIEIKARAVEPLVLECIRASNARCAVHSFDHRVAARMHALAPDVPTGILSASYLLDNAEPLRRSGARDYWQHWDLLDQTLVEQIHGASGRVIAWTVNSPHVAATLREWGVDGICTDVPAAIAPSLERVA